MDEDQLKARLAAIYNRVLDQSDVKPHNLRNKQFSKLMETLELIEQRLKWLARLHSFDTWYPCLRRELLGCSSEIDSSGLLLATHVLQKYAAPEHGKNDGAVKHETLDHGTLFRHDHVIDVDENYDMIGSCEEFWEAISLYRRHQIMLRDLGYGGKFDYCGTRKPEVLLSDRIRAELQDYAQRRCRDEALSEHGVPLRGLLAGSEYVVAFLPTLDHAVDGSVRYRIAFHAWTGGSVREFLIGYDRSLKKCYGLTPDDLTHALVSLSKPVLQAMLALGDRIKATGNNIEIVDPVPQDLAYQADIVRQLLLKGYARVPTSSIARQIEITLSSWCPTQQRRDEIAKQFMSVFARKMGRRSAVNLERGIGASLLVPANKDYTYVDYCHMRSLLSDILLTAQKYVGGQHGHNFNLLLEERINEIDPSYVVDSQLPFVVPRSGDEERKEGDWDLLLMVDGHAIVVECKAYIENDALARGTPQRVFSDGEDLKGTVKAQAKKELRALKALLHTLPELAPMRQARSFSAIVCTLKSEFIRSRHRFSTTPCGLPELVSMTELLDYCQEKKAQSIASASQTGSK